MHAFKELRLTPCSRPEGSIERLSSFPAPPQLLRQVPYKETALFGDPDGKKYLAGRTREGAEEWFEVEELDVRGSVSRQEARTG